VKYVGKENCKEEANACPEEYDKKCKSKETPPRKDAFHLRRKEGKHPPIQEEVEN
jgi:hypothetical protein